MTADLKPAPQPTIVSVSPVFVVAPAPAEPSFDEVMAMLKAEYQRLQAAFDSTGLKLPQAAVIQLAYYSLIDRFCPRPGSIVVGLNDWRDVNNDADDRLEESEWSHREESRL